MSFLRSTASRASSFARCARPAVRWQQTVQRRTYASSHGSHSDAKKSDLPWIVSSLAGTSLGVYLVLNQDLGGGHHEEHHEQLSTQPEEAQEKKPEEKDESEKDFMEPKADNKKDGGAKVEKSVSRKSANTEATREDKEGEKNSAKRADIEEGQQVKEGKDLNEADDTSSDSPDERDTAASRKEPHSTNETSGKQQGLSNEDTRHTSNIHDDPQKSKKGEGFAETAKLKGTVSTDRPDPANKEERGKPKMDKE